MKKERTSVRSNETPYSLRQIGVYFLLTFIISWSVFIPMLYFIPEESQTPYFVIGAFGPFIAATLVIWLYKGKTEVTHWLRSVFKISRHIKLYVYSLLILPIGIGLLQYSLYRMLGGNPNFSNAVPWSLYLIYLVLTLLTGGNEEPGWRGFSLPALLEHFHPLTTSIILGIVHSTWHLPLMNHYETSFGQYLFGLIPLTVILNWLFLKSRGSVIPVMFLHSGTNVISSFIPTPDVVLGGFGNFVFVRGLVYWGIAILIIIVTSGQLGYHLSFGFENDYDNKI